MARVTIRFVDGSKDDYETDASLVQRLKELKLTGLDGKELADKLLTDDWAAPPKWVHISDGDFETCLLYTSPSPRDQRGSRMPSSA